MRQPCALTLASTFRAACSVINGGGLTGTALRRIYVVNPCDPEALCPDGSCTVQGLCASAALPSASAIANQAPVVTLIGPDVVQITVGQVYAACGAASGPSDVCDRGASAADAEDGSLTPFVAACAATPASPYRVNNFQQAGLAGCALAGLSYSADTGTFAEAGTYNISFTAADSLGAVDMAVRTLVVAPSCAVGEHACDAAVRPFSSCIEPHIPAAAPPAARCRTPLPHAAACRVRVRVRAGNTRAVAASQV